LVIGWYDESSCEKIRETRGWTSSWWLEGFMDQ
jgi:hypothetical protein